MKNLLILGAGTAGTMMANHLRKRLPKEAWEITIVDKEKEHYYQPGYLFLPFDIYKPNQVKKSIDKFIPKGVNLIRQPIDRL
jgi:sulfide:quinone oxidoreductase